jgi:probable selenium-dependent hydroxylase accessory protein YqeC
VRIDRQSTISGALELGPGDVVSIVGAGGKTSLMYRLVRELVAAGVPVIGTTTTRILEPADGTMPEVALGEGNDSHIEVLRGLVEGRGMALTGSGEKDGKIIGHSPDFVDTVRRANPGWAIVAECDGARGKSLKVPEDHEPPLPSLTSVYIVVVGADCLGEQVSSEPVYNSRAVADVAGAAVDALLDDQLVAATVLSPASYMGRRPPGARMFVLVNKVKPGDVLPAGDECTPVEDNPVIALADRLTASEAVEGVILGSVGRSGEDAFAVLR